MGDRTSVADGIHRGLSRTALLPNVVLSATSAYLLLLTAAAWRETFGRRGLLSTTGPPAHRFLILVPAHDEEQLIAATVTDLGRLDYPADLFDVHVVADNCHDRTVELARAAGAEVHDRRAPGDPGKGPALQWLLERLWDRHEPHDAVVIVDADSTLSPNFLQAMDRHLTQGARVVQGYYAVRDPDRSTGVATRYAALAARHFLRPTARASYGGSTGLFGNGMVFATEVLRDRTWTNHLTEDIEFGLDLLLDGERVVFAPDAVVTAEMPVTLAAARSQNQRWERGRLEIARRYLPALLRTPRAPRRRQRMAQLDAAVDLALPPTSVLAVATVGAAAVSGGLYAAKRTRLGRVSLLLGLGSIVAQLLYVLSALAMVRAPRSVYRALLSAPSVVVWKLRLWMGVLGADRSVEWERTRRNIDPATSPMGVTCAG